MKISVTSYSYAQLTGTGEKEEIELIALAKSQGFDGIEFAEIHTPLLIVEFLDVCIEPDVLPTDSGDTLALQLYL